MASNQARFLFHNTMCDFFSLKQGVAIVAVTSIILSTVTLFMSLIHLNSSASKEQMYNRNPRDAIDLMFALVCSSASSYEIVISVLLLLFLRYSLLKKHVFLLTLWFVSNIHLLTVFFCLLLSRTIIYWRAEDYKQVRLTMILGIIYEAGFICFTIIVNSYEGSLDPYTLIC